MKCPFCGKPLKAIRSRKDTYVGGCDNSSCPVIFRTKEMYTKDEALLSIYDIMKYAKLEER